MKRTADARRWGLCEGGNVISSEAEVCCAAHSVNLLLTYAPVTAQ